MDDCTAKKVREVGHIPSELEELNKSLTNLDDELQVLATHLAQVLRSPTPSPTCDNNEADSRSDCPLANEIASSRRTVCRLTGSIQDLSDRLEV